MMEPQERDESSLRPRLSVRRRPTDHELSVRPALSRVPTDLLPPPMQSGQFTPELSPLDAFVNRGRQMYRQLGMQDKVRANSETGGHITVDPNAYAIQQQYQGLRQDPHTTTSPTSPQSPHSQQQIPSPQNQRNVSNPALAVPPSFVRSHTAPDGAAVASTSDVQSLNKAVENWHVGKATSSRGQPRDTQLFMGAKHVVAPTPHGPVGARGPPPMHGMRSPSLKRDQPSPPVMAARGHPAPIPLAAAQGGPQGLTVHEPSFRPVSQHPRISGIDLHDEGASHSLTVHQPVARHFSQHPRISAIDPGEALPSPSMPAVREHSLTRSNASSPRSPRMPTFGDDSDDDDAVSFTMTINSVSSKKEYQGRGRPDAVNTSNSRPLERSASNPHDDQLSPRSYPLTKQPTFPQRKSSKDSHRSYVARSPISPISPSGSQRSQKLPTPPRSASPSSYPRHNESFYGNQPTQHSQQQQQQPRPSLATPSMAAAATSTPNLSSFNNNEEQGLSHSPVEVNGEPLLPPQPAFAAHKSAPGTPRPSSAMSDHGSIYSIGGTRAMNFSRPMSKQSFHNADGSQFSAPPASLRKTSSDMSGPQRQYSYSTDDEDQLAPQKQQNEPPRPRQVGYFDIDKPSPLQALAHLERIPSAHRHQGSGSGKAGPSDVFTYSQYPLPRGRTVNRESVLIFGESHRFNGREEEEAAREEEAAAAAPKTPVPAPIPVDSNRNHAPLKPGTDGTAEGGLKTPKSPWDGIPVPPTPSSSSLRPSMDVASSRVSTDSSTPRPSMATTRARSSSTGPGARSQDGDAPKRPVTSAGAHALTPEQHLDIAIPLHEKGAYAESTYHFRLAALGGNSTGMLLYGLALRHGWGIRVSSTEAVNWLKKAADLAQSEMSDSDPSKPKPDWYQNKTQRAKFALAAYELGVSNLKGWGLPVNESLALNFFEIAASWGDTDAMQEAGNCYATGVGCKKDLKKSAKYYRQAEQNGVSMIGQSWIWKDKYLDDEDRAKAASKAEPRKENSKKGDHLKKDKKDKKDKKEHGNKFGQKKGSW